MTDDSAIEPGSLGPRALMEYVAKALVDAPEEVDVRNEHPKEPSGKDDRRADGKPLEAWPQPPLVGVCGRHEELHCA